jgi:hypothetical protein
LHQAGADAVTAPLATRTTVADIVLDRYDAARQRERLAVVATDPSPSLEVSTAHSGPS